MTMRMRILGLLSIAIIFAFALSNGATRSHSDEPARQLSTDAAAYEVQPVRLEPIVVAKGILEPVSSFVVTCPVDGTTTINALVPEGTRVKKGELVCELDPRPFRDQRTDQEIATARVQASLMNAKLARQVAEIDLAEYVEGIAKHDSEAIKREMATAEESIQTSTQDLERTKQAEERLRKLLAPKGDDVTAYEILASLQLDDRLRSAKARLTEERLRRELAQTKLEVFEKYTRDRRTKELKAEIEKKQSEERAKEQTLGLEEAKERRIRSEIEKCEIHAPGDGIVLYARERDLSDQLIPITEGAPVRWRQRILSVADLSRMRVRFKVREGLLGRITAGLKAKIELDPFPGDMLAGVITEVAAAPDRQSKLDRRERVYAVTAKIDTAAAGLRPGMTARVEVAAAPVEQALCVPVGAVVRFDGKDHVAVPTKGEVEWREVALGLSNATLVEIRKGITRGERIAADPVALMTESERRERFGSSRSQAERDHTDPASRD